MRKHFLAFAATLAAMPVVSAREPDPKPAVHKIVAVTVYQNNALITREVTVPEGLGVVELMVNPLPAETVPSSLYSESDNGTRILNTRFRARAIREDTREEVRKLQATLRQLASAKEKIQADLKAIEENQKFLSKLEGFTGATLTHLTDKGLLNSESTIALAKYVMTTRTERTKEIVALQQQIKDNDEQAAFASRQLNELSAGVSRTERDAVIVVDKANVAAGKVRLNYLVGAVAWKPQYKLRANKDKDPVTLEYLAGVVQKTGEDWTNVMLALSTAQPMLNAAPPELKSLEVSAVPINRPVGQPGSGPGGPGMAGEFAPGRFGGSGGKDAFKEIQQRAAAGRGQAQSFNNTFNWTEGTRVYNESAALEQYGELLASVDDIHLARRELGEVSEGPAVTYRLKTRLSLPSRNDEQTLEIARLELSPEFFYKAVPVLTPHVYRQATLTNKSDFVLLAGEATMYLGSDFVGRGELPIVAIGKQFTVGFGADPQVQVSRQLMSKDRKTTGGNQVLTFDYRILVNSYKAEPIKLQVWDRLPKAEAQAVAVSLVSQKPDLSTDTMYQREERPKNLLRWDVVVQPTQNGEKALQIDYTFRLELDRQMQIGTVVAK
ncbi:MAG: mucoidy inhibitor MuiA family protein [Gemmataceae bacterium]